jgi:phage shock protein A
MTGDMDNINRWIGGLQASVENLTRSWGEQDRKATEGRRELYRKFEELKNEVTRMTGRVDQLATDVAEIKPAVKKFEAAKNQNAGAQRMIKIIWGALVAGIAAVAYSITDIIHLFWPPRH